MATTPRKFPPKGMVGTPRGYVSKEARDKVDEAMQPVAEVGKELLWFTPLGKFGRAGKALFGAEKTAAKVVAKEAVKDTAKAVKAARPARGIKPGSMRQKVLDELKQGPKQPVAAKDVKPGSLRQKALDELKQGPKQARPASDIKPGDLRQKTLDSLKQGPKKPVKAADMKPGDARSEFLKEAKAGRIKAAKPPAPKAEAPRSFGMSRNQKIAAGAGAAGAAALGIASYKKADKASGASKPDNTRLVGGPRDDRSSSRNPGMDMKSKMQGRNVKGSPTYSGGTNSGTAKTPKNAGDKSRLANKVKPLSNFERMKQRQYEKEGVGGRRLTGAGARSQVMKERGYKFSDLFKRKK